jgi:hypothetical protein
MQQVSDRVSQDPLPLPTQPGQDAHRSRGRQQWRHGSPRTLGSVSAGRRPGSMSATGLRQPPRRRTRPSGSSPDSSSVTPWETVPSRLPAALATPRIPPCPGARAPATSPRCRRPGRGELRLAPQSRRCGPAPAATTEYGQPARDHLRLALPPPACVAEQPTRAGRRIRPQPRAHIHAQHQPAIGRTVASEARQRPPHVDRP